MRNLWMMLLVFCSAISFASDKALLDALVAKGSLTPEEASAISKNSAAQVVCSQQTKSLKLCATIQAQYFYTYSDADDPVYLDAPDKSNFQIRRLFVGTRADLGGGIKAILDFDLTASGMTDAKYMNVAFVSKTIEDEIFNGTACLGYMKVNFVVEEKTVANELITVDRSIATRYFTFGQRANTTTVGFGSAYAGVFWDGKADKILKGLGYGCAITNPQNWSIKLPSDDYGNAVNLWGNIYYAKNFEESDVSFKLGVNGGWGTGANSKLNMTGSPAEAGQIWGLNPYLCLSYSNWMFIGEFIMTGIEHGRNLGKENATPFGANLTLQYLFDVGEYGKFGPVARYSFIDSDGRGARISDCMASIPNTDTSGDVMENFYNNAHSIFAGLNWYIIDHYLKIQTGFEWAEFSGVIAASSVPEKRASAGAFRMQIQVGF